MCSLWNFTKELTIFSKWGLVSFVALNVNKDLNMIDYISRKNKISFRLHFKTIKSNVHEWRKRNRDCTEIFIKTCTQIKNGPLIARWYKNSTSSRIGTYLKPIQFELPIRKKKFQKTLKLSKVMYMNDEKCTVVVQYWNFF